MMIPMDINCICGVSWWGTIEEWAATKIREIFFASHQGEGHGECTAEAARKIRTNTPGPE